MLSPRSALNAGCHRVYHQGRISTLRQFSIPFVCIRYGCLKYDNALDWRYRINPLMELSCRFVSFFRRWGSILEILCSSLGLMLRDDRQPRSWQHICSKRKQNVVFVIYVNMFGNSREKKRACDPANQRARLA